MRLSFVMISALLLAGGLNQLCAQHSSGHSSGGHSISSSGSGFHARAGGSSGNHVVYPTYPTPIGLQRQFSTGVSGINGGALSTAPFQTGLRTGRGGLNGGRRYGALYGYYPYFDPFYDYGSGFYNNGPDQNYGYAAYDPGAETANVTANLLGEQMNRLSAQVQDLENEREQSMPVSPPRYRYNAPPLLPEDQTPSSVPLTLVLRDGRQIQLKSYAVMGQQIWDFSNQSVKKIPLSNIDLAASQKATEANGGEFPEIH